MDHDQFDYEAQRLFDWFKIKLSNEQQKHIYNQIRHIPPAAWADIVTRLCDDRRPAPTAFPTVREIHAEYHIWRSEHPESVTGYQQTKCPDCAGGGLLYYNLIKNGVKYQVMCGCAGCDNWRLHFNDRHQLTFHLRKALEERGVEVFPKQYGIPER